jgi:hypothetical protein
MFIFLISNNPLLCLLLSCVHVFEDWCSAASLEAKLALGQRRKEDAAKGLPKFKGEGTWERRRLLAAATATTTMTTTVAGGEASEVSDQQQQQQQQQSFERKMRRWQQQQQQQYQKASVEEVTLAPRRSRRTLRTLASVEEERGGANGFGGQTAAELIEGRRCILTKFGQGR